MVVSTTTFPLPEFKQAFSESVARSPASKTYTLKDLHPRIRISEKLYVRTASTRSGEAEYAKAIAILESPDAVRVSILVSKSPFGDMESIFSEMPIHFSSRASSRSLQASWVIDRTESMEKVTKVSVTVLLPCPIRKSLSLFGISELCWQAFPNIDPDHKNTYVRVSDGENYWDCSGVLRSPPALTQHGKPLLVPVNED